MEPIDLRSDTVTLPTEAMREAMRTAALGDDGLDGDPTVQRLEQVAAAVLGKADALFLASGTMGNLVASLAHASRGGEVIVDEHAHIVRSEVGGITRLAGLACHRVAASRGEMDLDRVRDLLRAGFTRDGQPTAMVVVESSHNHSGGSVPSLKYMRDLRALAQACGIPVHLDGARLFNAAHGLGVRAQEVADRADTVTICLSKGLSAPYGSVLAGPPDFIARARTFRRMVGGGLRQGGVVAAAGIVALEQMTDRLVEDHLNARRLWTGLSDSGWVGAEPPETNIVMLDVSRLAAHRPAQAWATLLAEHGVLLRARDARTLRAVTHRHVSAEQVDAAAGILRKVLR